MRITRETVLHTADLARLDVSSLSEADLLELTRQLDEMLSYVAQLDQLDTRDVPPTTHAVPLPIPMRRDEPAEAPGAAVILANAPRSEEGFFVVPRVIAES